MKVRIPNTLVMAVRAKTPLIWATLALHLCSAFSSQAAESTNIDSGSAGVQSPQAEDFESTKREAEKGDAWSQYLLGWFYGHGKNVPRDYAEAEKWFKLSAAQGQREAMTELGWMYEWGKGVAKDLNQTRAWYLKAADKGEPYAQHHLGLLFLRESPERAFNYFRLAAEQGYGEAMVKLFEAYRRGRGINRDWNEAERWLRKAAEAEDPYGQTLLGDLLENGRYWRDIPNYTEREINRPEAVRWYKRAVEQGWSGAQYNLALCYLSGSGIEQDEQAGLELMRKAADQDHSSAIYGLASLYAKGIGEPRDPSETPIKLLERVGAAKNHPDTTACYELVFRYEYGIGTTVDLVAASEWYCRRELGGYGRDVLKQRVNPGRVKESGFIIWKNAESPPELGQGLVNVLATFLQAGRLTDPVPLLEIANMYRRGQNAPKDNSKAWMWFSLAGDCGSAEARQVARELEKHLPVKQLESATGSKNRLKELLREAAAVAFEKGGSDRE